jgi:hypothetical protein
MCPEPFDKLRTAPVEGHWLARFDKLSAHTPPSDLEGVSPTSEDCDQKSPRLVLHGGIEGVRTSGKGPAVARSTRMEAE